MKRTIKKYLFKFIERFLIKDLHFCEVTQRHYGKLLGISIMFTDSSYAPNNAKTGLHQCGSIYWVFEAFDFNQKVIDKGPSYQESFGVMITLTPEQSINETHKWAKKIFDDTRNGRKSHPERNCSVMTSGGPRVINY